MVTTRLLCYVWVEVGGGHLGKQCHWNEKETQKLETEVLEENLSPHITKLHLSLTPVFDDIFHESIIFRKGHLRRVFLVPSLPE